MSKVVDRVDWGFVEVVMEKLGFHEKWICLVMHCITTISYSVLINGVAHGCIVPTRGLHQGDSLSPYLFLLCAEGLSTLINETARNQALHGISICRGCPRVTHLLFANDNLLFCLVNGQERMKLIEILDLYEAAFGQMINTDKSSVFFSQNTPQATKDEVMHILGPMQDTRHTKYLGLPSLIGKSKTQVFAEIKEGVGKKLSGWKEKILFVGGKGYCMLVLFLRLNMEDCKVREVTTGRTGRYYK